MITQVLILSVLFRLTTRLPLISSPLLMGLWVLFIALSLSAWIGVIGIRWFGIILFLIYIGGILVIFIYFVAVTPNQRHDLKVFVMAVVGGVRLFYIIIFRVNLIKNFSKAFSLRREIMIFFFSQRAVLVVIFIILFVGLIIVVKITRLIQGPLRPFK